MCDIVETTTGAPRVHQSVAPAAELELAFLQIELRRAH